MCKPLWISSGQRSVFWPCLLWCILTQEETETNSAKDDDSSSGVLTKEFTDFVEGLEEAGAVQESVQRSGQNLWIQIWLNKVPGKCPHLIHKQTATPTQVIPWTTSYILMSKFNFRFSRIIVDEILPITTEQDTNTGTQIVRGVPVYYYCSCR